jgi:hypothetical protein
VVETVRVLGFCLHLLTLLFIYQPVRYTSACHSLFARYTTFVQPPTAKNRDDHILPTLISILRDNTKVEVKLRRRCVAALGELVFYITAQEEETHTTTGTAESRWALPHGAITVLTKCLKDDSDEAVRHYAAKVRTSPPTLCSILRLLNPVCCLFIV